MPAKTIAEVISQLNEIVIRAERLEDRTGYFAALYKKVTVAVLEKIKEGYFDDNERMEKLDVVFASRYLDAYDAYNSGKQCSKSWQLAFDTAKSWRPMVIHHLLAGMNAHISLDLGIAAATVCPGNTVEDIHTDFNKINAILGSLIDEVKTELFAMWPLSKLLVKMNTGKLENEIAGFSMTIARDASWQMAVEYARLHSDSLRENYILERDKKVAAFGRKILYPGFWLGIPFTLFRVFEFGRISSKIKKLDN